MQTYSRPNVLLIYTDQQRWDSLRCYGNELAYTPNLDLLAERGALFEKHFIQNPVCMPSRMSMLTGRYCSSTGVGWNGPSLPDGLMPVNKLLKPYGYHTAQIGKLHFDPHAKRDHRDPTDTYGFDTFILSDEPGCYDDAYTKWVEMKNPAMVDMVRTSIPPEAYHYGQPEYSTQPRNTHEPFLFEGEEGCTHSDFVTDQTIQFIRDHKDDRFFAIAGFYAPHTPVNPPKRFVELYEQSEMPLPVLGESEVFQDFLQGVGEEEWREIVMYYLALVSHVDDCVGKILDELDEHGLTEETLIIFTADHGEYLGDHGRIQKGMPGHDCITRVPLLMSYPAKITPGSMMPQLVESVDIVPTILDICGVQTPGYVQGRSVVHLFDNPGESHRDDVFTEAFYYNGGREGTVRTRFHKYYCASDGRELLYDMTDDPNELTDQSGNPEYSKVLADMRKRLILRIQEAAYNGPKPEAGY